MKNPNIIIDHISSNPCFYKLKESKCLNALKEILPARLSSPISFMYIKNDTLFIAVKHYGAKMELNNDYNISLIKRLLKLLKKQEAECEKFTKDKIKIFVTDKKENVTPNSHENSYKNKELAKGFFINQATDETIKSIFENIRKSIKEN